MRKRLVLVIAIVLLLLTQSSSALAQVYYFQVPELTIDVFWNEDGTSSILYEFTFVNDSSDPIEYVDLGLPNGSIDESQISAEVDGTPVAYISKGEFEGEGSSGVAIALGSGSIPSGQTGVVRIYVTGIENVLYPDTDDDNYASAVFKNPYFISSVIHGTTDLTITFHLPPGVQPEEPRWHTASGGFPSEPVTGYDEEGRVTYTWQNPNTSLTTAYEFGASFPQGYVPESAIIRPNPFAWISNISFDACFPFVCFGFVILLIASSTISQNKRKMKYLPPKITIEGHGIKRGLTAVEAAILLEQPLDKVLTMILFSTIKKGTAEVVRRDPLEINVIQPIPEDLYEYEKNFLAAFQEKSASARQKALETCIVGLIKSISGKMKGFSRSETIDYYKSITQRAWEQVEAADTPEVKSQKFDEVMEWTMLDRNYDDRTRDVFRQQPVFIPTWWGRYDPVSATKVITTSGKTSAGGTSLPHLPGSDFAASIANGVQGFSAGVVGDITGFTSRVTTATNPIPKSTSGGYKSGGSSSGGRSCACACACACAGCACACAGGGR